MDKLEQYLLFIKEAEQLKSVLRTAWTADGQQESTAEHSWRLALLAGLMAEDYPELDTQNMILMCLIHDMGELYDGDISAALMPDEKKKHEQEYKTIKKVFGLLPAAQNQKLTNIWLEYNDNKSPEAKLVKALDKAETIIQHNQGMNPEDFDYSFNLSYGAAYFEQDKTLTKLREMIDQDTKKHISQSEKR